MRGDLVLTASFHGEVLKNVSAVVGLAGWTRPKNGLPLQNKLELMTTENRPIVTYRKVRLRGRSRKKELGADTANNLTFDRISLECVSC